MLPSNLDELTADHIQELIDAEVAESLTLEYKRELPSGQSEQKREFLYDVAAMANAAGGHIIYGILDKRGQDNQSTGIAEGMAGLSLPNVQTEIARLSNLVRNSIAPRVTGIAMQAVTHADGDALVVRIPKSWSRPHMVTIDGVNKFFGRVATGKYPMSVDEIGRAFSEQGELGEKIDHWREHRAELALKKSGPMPLANHVSMLFHAIPESAFTRRDYRETWRVSEQEASYIYVPHTITNHRYNADGFIAFASVGNEPQAYGYTQLFRSGIVEYADNHCFGPIPNGMDSYAIYGLELERQMIQCYKDAITRIRKEGRTEAFYIGFSLIGIKGKAFYVTLLNAYRMQAATQQDVFTSPTVLVDPNDSDEHPYPKTLLPLVDTMWQLAGRSGTPFKKDGEWQPFQEWR